MPNWCDNKLIVSGDKTELSRFLKEATTDDGEFTFEKIVPRPKELDITCVWGYRDKATAEQGLKNIELFGFRDWYEWNIANYGTKWNVGESNIEDMGGLIEIEFGTAWSPPIPWVKKVVQLFPELEFVLHYDEPGMSYKGVYSKGTDKCIEY